MDMKESRDMEFDAISVRCGHLMQECEEVIRASDQNSTPYEVITSCLSLYSEIEKEIIQLHNLIRCFYGIQFPELEFIINHPIDYIRVVKKIGKEMDITQVDLQGVLPSNITMVLCMIKSTTSGTTLTDSDLDSTIHACDQALALDFLKGRILELLEARTVFVAPNLCAVLGNFVASKLMAAVGGITELANMTASDIMVLGSKINNPAGFSTVPLLHVGYVRETREFKTTPSNLRKKLCRLLAGKCVLAARVDSVNGDPSGKVGRELREGIHEKIDKWQQLPPANKVKPLAVPNLGHGNRKKRGGRRFRKMKERYAMTYLRKYANRIQFGVPENSSLGDGLGTGFGMLSQCRYSKLAANITSCFFNKS